MTGNEIKAQLILKVGGIAAAAAKIKESPDAVSATIHYHRKNDRIRQKLATRFGVWFSEQRVRINELRKAA